LFDTLDGYDGITYHGYVIDKTRADWRVTVEGFNGIGLSADQFLTLYDCFTSADDFNFEKQPDGTYTLYVWWD
jgi:hypothetical protein